MLHSAFSKQTVVCTVRMLKFAGDILQCSFQENAQDKRDKRQMTNGANGQLKLNLKLGIQ